MILLIKVWTGDPAPAYSGQKASFIHAQKFEVVGDLSLWGYRDRQGPVALRIATILCDVL